MHRKTAALVLALIVSETVLSAGQSISAPIPDSVKAQHRTLFPGYFSGGKSIDQETRAGHDVDITAGRDIDTVMDLEGIKESRQNPYPAMFLRGISCGSDVVVVAVPRSSEANMTADGNGLFTDYRFAVETVLKNETAMQLEDSSIIVTRPGGQATINGRSVRVSARNFPLFTIGHKYVLFLQHLRSTDTFVAFDVGSFELVNGTAVPFRTMFSNIQSLKDEVAFLTEVRAAISAPCLHQTFPGLGRYPEGL